MKNLSTYVMVAAMAALTVSCKKDGETTPAPSKTDLLTAKTWRVTDLKASGQSIYNSGLFDACEKDNLYKFNTNKSATFDEGATKCTQSDPQTQTGKWDLTANETKFKLTDPTGDVVEGEIITLTSTLLVVRDPNYQGSTTPVEVTYAAQ